MMFSPSSDLSFGIWMFSILAPIIAMYSYNNSLTDMTICAGIIAQLSIAGFLIFLLTRQLKQAGESATKALERVRS
jgi:hypothetical protein